MVVAVDSAVEASRVKWVEEGLLGKCPREYVSTGTDTQSVILDHRSTALQPNVRQGVGSERPVLLIDDTPMGWDPRGHRVSQ